MKAYQADIAKFESSETQVFGLSVDSIPANREFAKQIGVTFPLLSDFKRTVVKDYGVFNEDQGFGNRATFVIDKAASFNGSTKAAKPWIPAVRLRLATS